MTAAASAEPSAQRYELLRAVGVVADSPAGAAAACRALGLADPGAAVHTEAFVMNCPPYAAIYLGADGGLGGEGADRVAGFWRAAGFSPPAEPDHLTALLGLYASLGEAAQEARRASTAGALTRARSALFQEHLWPWLPGYLDAVADLGIPALADWAGLAGRVLRAEYAMLAAEAGGTGGSLPLVLRSAPPPASAGAGLGDLLDVLTTPVRSGFILTRRRLASGAEAAGAGYRIGERRFALRAMLEQEHAGTLTWLAEEAGRWQRRHAARAAGDPVHEWWAERAGQTARMLTAAGGLARRPPDGAAHPAAAG
ncbi:MAG: molecular chaperone TorD family protein [Gemmatimonadota bacterium]